MVCDPRLHRGRNAQRLTDPAEVIVNKVDRKPGAPGPDFRTWETTNPASVRNPHAARSKSAIFGRRLRLARHKSYCVCKSIHRVGLVPSASEKRSDISAEMPALQFRMRESVTRETRSRFLHLHLAQPLPQHASRMRRIEHFRHVCASIELDATPHAVPRTPPEGQWNIARRVQVNPCPRL
jgi:hypothetical protein